MPWIVEQKQSASSLCLLMGLLSLAGCDLLGGVDRKLSRAEAALAAGDYNTAAVLLQDAAGNETTDTKIQLLLVRAQLFRGDLPGAEAALRSAGETGEANELRAQLSLDRRQFAELHEQLGTGRLQLSGPVRDRFLARALQGLGSPIQALEIYERLLQSEPLSPELQVLAAECHATLGRSGKALALVESVLDKHPTDAKAWALKSRLLLEARDSVGARTAWKQAIDHAPGRLTAPEQASLLTNEISAALAGREIEQADSAYQKLLALLPQAPITEWAGTQLKLAKGDVSGALSAAQLLVKHAPDFPPAKPALVGALLAAGNHELAAHEIGVLAGAANDRQGLKTAQDLTLQAASTAPGDPRQQLQAGQAAMLLEQYVAARSLFDMAAARTPESDELKLAVAQLHLRTGRAREAADLLAQLDAGSPGNAAILTALANAQSLAGESAAAIRTLESLWSIAPNGPNAVSLTQASLKSGREDALSPLAQWVSSHPDDVAARLVLASSLQQLGQLDRAKSEYEKVIGTQPGNAVALNNLAWIYYLHKDRRAVPTAKKAYELAPGVPSIADTYGWLLAESGQATEAVPILQAAARAAPGNPTIRYHLAAALLRAGGRGNGESARQMLADLMRDDSAYEGREEAIRLGASEGLT